MKIYPCLAYETAILTLGLSLSLMLRMKCEGKSNVPAGSGALMVSNHRNPILDPTSIALNIERPFDIVYDRV